MLHIRLDDSKIKTSLFPFAQTRSVADIRVGIFTIREKWELLSGNQIKIVTGNTRGENSGDKHDIAYPANVIPDKNLVASILAGDKSPQSTPQIISYPWNIFQLNDWAIREDFKLASTRRYSESIPESVEVVKGAANIFLEEGARLQHCTLNAADGPIYLGKDTEIMEGAYIRGPFALCEGAVIKMGARVYGATTVGPYSTVGGEIKNSVIFGYSNKAHDGYLGDSVIGEWCNIGAGTSNSNLKNNAGEVKVWHQAAKDYVPAGLKCGLLMGDYSRCAINTSFNTGTVVGISANVFGAGLTPKIIPDFAWGFDNSRKYEFDKATADIANWKKLKNKELSQDEIQTLKSIFDGL